MDTQRPVLRAVERRNRKWHRKLKWVPLLNPEGNAVETVPQALAGLARLHTQRADDNMPVLGRTSIFSDYADNYLALIKAARAC